MGEGTTAGSRKKSSKGKKKTKRRKDGDGTDAGESDERKAGGVEGGKTRFNEPEE